MLSAPGLRGVCLIAHSSTSRPHRSGRSRIESAPPAVRTTPSAPSWHVPLPVLSGPPGSRLRAASVFLGPLASSGEVRAPRGGDRRVGEDVDERRSPAGERALERRTQLARLAHELTVAAERLDDLV